MSYTVLATKRVDKKLNRLHPFDRRKAFKTFSLLKTTPLPEGANIQKLQKSENNYRIRTGNIRIIYNFDPQKKEIVILNVGYRGGMYRKF